jgi:SHS2 domain-containing protein
MYRWVEHTAELELAIAAAGEREVLSDALAALHELLAADEPRHPSAQRTIEVTAPDRPALLAAWLEELVYLAESQGFVGAELVDCRISENRLDSVVGGELGEPRPIVKAVTYHRLAFEPTAEGYVATVVLDV